MHHVIKRIKITRRKITCNFLDLRCLMVTGIPPGGASDAAAAATGSRFRVTIDLENIGAMPVMLLSKCRPRLPPVAVVLVSSISRNTNRSETSPIVRRQLDNDFRSRRTESKWPFPVSPSARNTAAKDDDDDDAFCRRNRVPEMSMRMASGSGIPDNSTVDDDDKDRPEVAKTGCCWRRDGE